MMWNKFRIAGKAVLLQCIAVTVYPKRIVRQSPDNREKDGCRASPIGFVSVPEIFYAITLYAFQLSTNM